MFFSYSYLKQFQHQQKSKPKQVLVSFCTKSSIIQWEISFNATRPWRHVMLLYLRVKVSWHQDLVKQTNEEGQSIESRCFDKWTLETWQIDAVQQRERISPVRYKLLPLCAALKDLLRSSWSQGCLTKAQNKSRGRVVSGLWTASTGRQLACEKNSDEISSPTRVFLSFQLGFCMFPTLFHLRGVSEVSAHLLWGWSDGSRPRTWVTHWGEMRLKKLEFVRLSFRNRFRDVTFVLLLHDM